MGGGRRDGRLGRAWAWKAEEAVPVIEFAVSFCVDPGPYVFSVKWPNLGPRGSTRHHRRADWIPGKQTACETEPYAPSWSPKRPTRGAKNLRYLYEFKWKV